MIGFAKGFNMLLIESFEFLESEWVGVYLKTDSSSMSWCFSSMGIELIIMADQINTNYKVIVFVLIFNKWYRYIIRFYLIEEMDTTPLGMQFKEFDTDHDGRITGNEAHELLKLLDKNIYLGTVQYVWVIGYRLPN